MNNVNVGLFNKIRENVLKILCLFFVIIATIVFTLSVTYNVKVSMNGSETPLVSLNPTYWFLIFLFWLIALVIIQPQLNRVKSKWLFLILLVIFLICGSYLVIFSDDYLRGSNPSSLLRVDPGSCVTIARHLNNGLYIDLKKNGYAYMYPFQLYWISFLRLLLKINNTVRFLYWMNLLFSAMSLIFTYLISRKLLKEQNKINTSIILSFTFFPILFNVLFVYSNVMALLLFLIASYFAVCYAKDKGQFKLYTAIFFYVGASLIKNNYLIGIISFFIVLCLSNETVKSKVVAILLVIVLLTISNVFISSYYSLKSHTQISTNNGIPKSSYIVMGLSESGLKSGWFDGSTVREFMAEGYSTKKTNIVSKKKLENKVKYLVRHPKNLINLFYNEWVTTWGDPTYESLFNAPLSTWGGKLKTRLMKKIYEKNQSTQLAKTIRRISQISVWTILLLSILSSLHLILNMDFKPNSFLLYSVYVFLFFVGGFIFHTIWETKSQYVYQYIFLLIVPASVSVDYIYNAIENISGVSDKA